MTKAKPIHGSLIRLSPSTIRMNVSFKLWIVLMMCLGWGCSEAVKQGVVLESTPTPIFTPTPVRTPTPTLFSHQVETFLTREELNSGQTDYFSLLMINSQNEMYILHSCSLNFSCLKKISLKTKKVLLEINNIDIPDLYTIKVDDSDTVFLMSRTAFNPLIYKLSPEHQLLQLPSTYIDRLGLGQKLLDLADMAFNSKGELLITESRRKRILKLVDGKWEDFSGTIYMEDTDFFESRIEFPYPSDYVKGIFMIPDLEAYKDLNGFHYNFDLDNGIIHRASITTTTEFIPLLQNGSRDEGRFWHPGNIEINSKDEIFVQDAYGFIRQVYPDGSIRTFLKLIPKRIQGQETAKIYSLVESKFTYTESLGIFVIGPDDRLYFIDGFKLSIVDQNGQIVKQINLVEEPLTSERNLNISHFVIAKNGDIFFTHEGKIMRVPASAYGS